MKMHAVVDVRAKVMLNVMVNGRVIKYFKVMMMTRVVEPLFNLNFTKSALEMLKGDVPNRCNMCRGGFKFGDIAAN